MGRRFAARGVDWAAPRLRAGGREAGPGRPGLGGSGRPVGESGKIWEAGWASVGTVWPVSRGHPHPPSVYTPEGLRTVRKLYTESNRLV